MRKLTSFIAIISISALAFSNCFAQDASYSASNKNMKVVKNTATLTISGQVKNYHNDEPVSADITFVTNPFGLTAGKVKTNTDGTYKIKLPCGKHYKYVTKCTGFIDLEQEIDASRMEYNTEINTDLFVVPAKKGSSIRLENIFFDYGTSNIKTTSYAELNRVTNWMKDHPNIKVEISGHSDNVGSAERNKLRSKERADVVAAYITSKGIAKERVISVGHGDKYPAFPNSSEKGRTMNRRVEMKIIED